MAHIDEERSTDRISLAVDMDVATGSEARRCLPIDSHAAQ